MPFDPETPHCCATAAGGRFRNAAGRQIFQTRQLCQSVLRPDVVTNKVCLCIGAEGHDPLPFLSSTAALLEPAACKRAYVRDTLMLCS